MAKFMIEVPHEADTVACIKAAKILLESGSHFMTHAEFGCFDGVHKAWIVVDVDDKTEARNTLHPSLRPLANIVSLNRFSIEQLDELMAAHGGAK